jgi:type III pantothenate kinase
LALLTVDLGNTSCKLRLWADDTATRGAEAPTAGGLEDALAAFVAEAPEGTRAALCSVAAPELEDRVADALRAALGAGYLGIPEPGVENTCRDPHTVGLDRLFAARGAMDALGRSALVVDAGTALTVDAVQWARAGVPRFLGGAIAPGPDLMAAALASGAARLPRVEPRPRVPALGLDTPSAIAAGVLHGFRGAATELVRRIGAESGLGCECVALTGGARGLLSRPRFLPEATIEELPDLVHLGLRVAVG